MFIQLYGGTLVMSINGKHTTVVGHLRFDFVTETLLTSTQVTCDEKEIKQFIARLANFDTTVATTVAMRTPTIPLTIQVIGL